ncbi:hypothetical protein D3C71_1405140 [compost metagenome]
MRAQEQGLPRAAQHQDLIGRHLGAALQVQVGGNRLAQRLRTLRIAMQQHIGAVVLHRLALQALPDIRREGARFRQPRGKRLDRLLVDDAAAVEYHPAAPAQARARLRRSGACVLRPDAPAPGAPQLGADRLGNVAARALPPHDVAIAMQLHIGILDGVAGNAQR